MRRLIAAVVVLIAVVAIWLYYRSTPRSTEIVIAVAGPMTGQYATFGEQMRRGAQQAVNDINAAGGILGRPLRLEVGDDACDPKQAVTLAQYFANQQIKFISGH